MDFCGQHLEVHRRGQLVVVIRFRDREGRRVVTRHRRHGSRRIGHRRSPDLRRGNRRRGRLPVGPVRNRGRGRPLVVRLHDLEVLVALAGVVALARERRGRGTRVGVVLEADFPIVLREDRRISVICCDLRFLRIPIVHVVAPRRKHQPDVVVRQFLRRHRHLRRTGLGCVARRRHLIVDRLVRADIHVLEFVKPRTALTLGVLDRIAARRSGHVHRDAITISTVLARRPVHHALDLRCRKCGQAN